MVKVEVVDPFYDVDPTAVVAGVDVHFVVLTVFVVGYSDLWELSGCPCELHAWRMRHQRTSQFLPPLSWLYTLGGLGDT